MKRLALALALVILATMPLWAGSTYYVNIASQILFYAIFALGVNVLAGYAGLVSLGHAGLFGIAAYAGARIMNDGHGQLVVAAGALGLTLLVSAIFAVLALRGTGLGGADDSRAALRLRRGCNPAVKREPVESIMQTAFPFVDISTPVDLLSTMITPANPAVLVRDFKTDKTFIITRSDVIRVL